MAEAQADPLSYFAAYGSSSSESEPEPEPEVEAAGTGTGARERQPGAGAGAGEGGAAAAPALPAPHELFGRVSRPSFLRDPRGPIDWERRRLRPPHEPPKEFRAWKGSAVPPPESYDTEERKVPSGVDMAVKWSSMYQDHGDDAPHRDTESLPGTADNPDSDEENKEEPSSKKLRTESFQQKEKRKRNEGQANREKSFVEEEKRILRQEFCPKE